MAGNLVSARMANAAAASYPNCSAGRTPQLAMPARDVKELEVSLQRAVAALRIPGKSNPVADALSRFSIGAHGLGLYPHWELRAKFRREVDAQCVAMHVDMMSSSNGSNAGCPENRPPSDSAIEGPLPIGRLWWFPARI